MKEKSTASLGHVLGQKWPLLIGVPLANILLVGIFWQSQIWQYARTTTGVVFTWLVAGLIFILIQLSLQASALRHKLQEDPSLPSHLEIVWSLAAQVAIFVFMAIYNIVALIALWRGGGRPVHFFDGLIVFIVISTLLVVVWRYRHAIRDPRARLLLATGTKALPQYVQAGSLAIMGSAGMHPLTILAIAAMGVLRFALSHHAAAGFRTKQTIAANQAAWRDMLSIGAMCLGWVIGAFR